MLERVTAKNATHQNLDRIAIQAAGAMGLYTRKEYDALTQVDNNDWGFRFVESNLDVNTGKVKLMPKSARGKFLLNKGRADKMKERHPWFQTERLIEITKSILRHGILNTKRGQDIILTAVQAYFSNTNTPKCDEFKDTFNALVNALPDSKFKSEFINVLRHEASNVPDRLFLAMTKDVPTIRRPTKKTAGKDQTPRSQTSVVQHVDESAFNAKES